MSVQVVPGEKVWPSTVGFVPTQRFRWNSRIACRTLEETAFILWQSQMVSLNSVGTFVWEQFRNGSSLREIVDAVENEFEASWDRVALDVSGFVEELVERKLLIEEVA